MSPTRIWEPAPADLVLMVGILGNISNAELTRTIAAGPVLCGTGVTLIWSCGRRQGDRNGALKARFSAAGFTELGYATLPRGSCAAVAAMRYDGPRGRPSQASAFSRSALSRQP